MLVRTRGTRQFHTRRRKTCSKHVVELTHLRWSGGGSHGATEILRSRTASRRWQAPTGSAKPGGLCSPPGSKPSHSCALLALQVTANTAVPQQGSISSQARQAGVAWLPLCWGDVWRLLASPQSLPCCAGTCEPGFALCSVQVNPCNLHQARYAVGQGAEGNERTPSAAPFPLHGWSWHQHPPKHLLVLVVCSWFAIAHQCRAAERVVI